MTDQASYLLFIGMSRAGSTWLEHTLRADERFHLPLTKDLFFFDKFFDRGAEWLDSRYEESEDPTADAAHRRTRVDIGHDYAVGPWVPDRISATLGTNWRGLLVIREPVSWLESQVRFGLRSGIFDRAELDRGNYHSLVELIEIAPFDRLVAHWKKRVGPQLHVALFDDLKDDPAQFLCDLKRHCGIEGLPILPIESAVNIAMQPRWEPVQRAGRAVLAWSRSRDLTAIERVIKSAPMSRLAHTNNPVDFHLPVEVASELREYWTDGVLRLDVLVPGVADRWGYRRCATA